MGLNPATWSGRYGIVGSEEAPSLVMVGNDLEYSVRLPIGEEHRPTFVRHEGVIADLFTEVRWYYVRFASQAQLPDLGGWAHRRTADARRTATLRLVQTDGEQ